LTIAGTAVLRFDQGGQVADHRDYWAQQDGRRTPPRAWGR
jgi:hypothetical protein